MALLKKLFGRKDSFDDFENDLSRGSKGASFSFDDRGASDEFSSRLGTGKTRLGGDDIAPPTSSYGHPFKESSLSLTPPASSMANDQSAHDMQLILKNLELLSSKIDSLKAALESVGQRVETVERIALQEQRR